MASSEVPVPAETQLSQGKCGGSMQCVVKQCHFPAHREAEQLVSPFKTKPVLVIDITTEINDNKNIQCGGAPKVPSVLQVVKGGRGWKEGKTFPSVA